MIINRNSWHYKLYQFTYSLSNSPARYRSQTNLCQYVQRIFWMAPIIAVCAVVIFVFAAIMITCACLFGPLFGWLPKQWKKPWDIFDGMHKYQGLPVGRSYNAYQFYPWHGILLAIIVAFEWVIQHCYGFHPLIVQGEVVGGIIVFVGSIIGLLAYFDSSTGKVVNEYLAAKKQKVCPVVEFKNEEQAP